MPAMFLDLLSSTDVQTSVALKPSLGRGHLWSIALPIALSSMIAGVWSDLAFFHHPGRMNGGVAILLALLCFVTCFIAVEVLAGASGKTVQARERLRHQLARASFASIVLVLFLPEYMARVPPPYLRSWLLLTIVLLLWGALSRACILYERAPDGPRITDRATHQLAAAGLLSLFTITTTLAVRKYLVFGYVGQDLAYFGQILHTTLHGHLFWGNLLQDLIYSRTVTTDFAGHNSPMMFLFLPFYALFPTPITLLVLRNVVMLGCAFPVFLLARRHASVPIAWLWAAAFLLTPAILYQSFFDFYPLSFVTLPLLFTLFFYLEQRYKAFCVAMLCTLLVREDLVFFVFGLGLLALIRHRSPRWTLVPLAVAAAWAILSFFVVLPAGLHGATFVTDACFSHLGTNARQMLQSVVFHPRENILVRGNIVYLKTLLTATGLFLSCGSLVTLLCLPYVAINLLAGAGPCITTVIFAQYSVVPATLLFAGALLSMERRTPEGRLARFARLGLFSNAVPPLLLIALCCGSLVFVTGKPQVDELRTQPWGNEARHVLSLVPATASVAAPRYMLPHLANRDCLYQAHRLLQYHSAIYEYLILDLEWSHINASDAYRTQYARVIEQAAADPSFETIYSSAEYRVYMNAAAAGRTCRTTGDTNVRSPGSVPAHVR